jgi:predicted transcriptional regulator
MAQTERKHEKKAKPSAEKPAPEPLPQPKQEPRQDAGSPSTSTIQALSATLAPSKARDPVSIADLEPIPSTKGRSKPRSIPIAAAAASAANDGLVVEPASMPPEAVEEPDVGTRGKSAEPSISTPDLVVEAAKNDEQDELAAVEYEDLTDIEKDVLRVAKNSLKKKRFEADIGFEPFTPMVEKIVGDCVAKYQAQKGYSKDSIVGTLKGLEEQRWIVTAERRTKEEILGDGLYQDITRFLEAYPGTHARDERIQQKLGITRNPFLKHVLVLDRFQLIQKHKFGKLWNFFAPSFTEDEEVAELVVVMYNDIVRQLIRLLIKNPGSTLVELARNIIPPVYHGAIQYHLKKLEELGLVIHDGSNRVVNMAMLRRYNAVVCDELKIAG